MCTLRDWTRICKCSVGLDQYMLVEGGAGQVPTYMKVQGGTESVYGVIFFIENNWTYVIVILEDPNSKILL